MSLTAYLIYKDDGLDLLWDLIDTTNGILDTIMYKDIQMENSRLSGIRTHDMLPYLMGVFMLPTIDSLFIGWLIFRVEHYGRIWYRWWRRQVQLRLILPTEDYRLAQSDDKT